MNAEQDHKIHMKEIQTVNSIQLNVIYAMYAISHDIKRDPGLKDKAKRHYLQDPYFYAWVNKLMHTIENDIDNLVSVMREV